MNRDFRYLFVKANASECSTYLVENILAERTAETVRFAHSWCNNCFAAWLENIW